MMKLLMMMSCIISLEFERDDLIGWNNKLMIYRGIWLEEVESESESESTLCLKIKVDNGDWNNSFDWFKSHGVYTKTDCIGPE